MCLMEGGIRGFDCNNANANHFSVANAANANNANANCLSVQTGQ